MFKIKVFAAILLLSSMMVMGKPGLVRTQAYDMNDSVPAVVFMQDKNEKMLVYHNFEYDNGISIPWNMNIDDGFYVNASEAK